MQIEIGVLLGLVSMFAWGISDFIMKGPSRRVGVLRIQSHILLLMLIYATTLALFFPFPAIELRHIALGALAGVFILWGGLSFIKGLSVGNVSIISPIGAAYSSIVVVFAVFILGETLTDIKVAGIIAMLAGIAIISIRSRKRSKVHLFEGVPYAFMAFIGWGFGFSISALVTTEVGPVPFIVIISAFMFLYVLIIHLLTNKKFKFIEKKDFSIIGIAATLNFLSYLAFMFAASYKVASIAAPVGTAYPAIAIMLAAVFYRERLTIYQKLGAFAIVAALVALAI